MSDSLFDRIGGEAAVNAAVELFYRKVLEDYRINRFFDNTNMEEQIGDNPPRRWKKILLPDY